MPFSMGHEDPNHVGVSRSISGTGGVPPTSKYAKQTSTAMPMLPLRKNINPAPGEDWWDPNTNSWVPDPQMGIQPVAQPAAPPQARPMQQLMQQVTGPMMARPAPELANQYSMLLDYLYGRAGMSNPMGEISPMRRAGAQMLGLF